MLLCVLSASYIEIKLEAMISTISSYLDVGVIVFKYILSSSHNFADADPVGALESCSGAQNDQKKTQNNVLEL